MRRVAKFGGKSLANGSPLRSALDLIRAIAGSDTEPPVVVVSARGATTDSLIDLAERAKRGEEYEEQMEALVAYQRGEGDYPMEELDEELERLLRGVALLGVCPPSVMAEIVSLGERYSARYITHLLREAGLTAEVIDAGDLLVTDDHYEEARVDVTLSEAKTKAYFARLAPGTIAVVTGYIARSEAGERTTLGRNGSNYTAALLAGMLEVDLLDNYTNVDGIYSAHPGLVLDAHKLDQLSYSEAAELSQFGAEILHYKTIDPIAAKGIPMRVLNSFHPDGIDQQGTTISADPGDRSAKAIAILRGKAAVHLEGREMMGKPGIDARIFGTLNRLGVSASLVSQGSSERGIAIVVDDADAERSVEGLRETFREDFREGLTTAIYAERDLAIMALIGVGLDQFDRPYVALVRNGIRPLLFLNAPTGDSIFLLLKDNETLTKAVHVIHGELFEHPKRIHIACIGHGTVGGAFLDQLHAQRKAILERQRIDLRLFAVAGSHRLLLDAEGIGSDWRERFDALPDSGIDVVGEITRFATEHLLENVVVIDNTASEAVARSYFALAESGFDLVSSNKIFNTGSYADYSRLRQILDRHRRSYRYETNVGAGLPLIENLHLLHVSGDRITRIRGLFSGSLGFILSSLDRGDCTFLEALHRAMAAGYTEPDPRIDLSGKDVARKLLILAREIGLPVEMKAVVCQNLVPEEIERLAPEEVTAHEEELNRYFDSLMKPREGYVIRYVGEIDCSVTGCPPILRCGLEQVPEDSALGSVRGTDSCFEIYTVSYGERPFVIQGAGAGAEVTARGVFGDLLRIAERND